METTIVTSFQRVAHSYVRRPPRPYRWLEWLALIQHHGGPTRLLDFTHSIYVAAFFAFDDRCGNNPTIWCVNHGVLRQIVKDHNEWPGLTDIPWANPSEGSQAFDVLAVALAEGRARISGFAAGVFTPINKNRRLQLQQGTFLTSLNMEHTLEENLFGMFDLTPDDIYRPPQGYYASVRKPETLHRLQRSPFVQIILEKTMRAEALTELGRMNISHASLFPGLDGFARELKRQAYWSSLEANATPPAPDASTAEK